MEGLDIPISRHGPSLGCAGTEQQLGGACVARVPPLGPARSAPASPGAAPEGRSTRLPRPPEEAGAGPAPRACPWPEIAAAKHGRQAHLRVMERPGPGSGTPTLYVRVGLTASGKTTRAKEIETDCHALRLTPDEWMVPLFADRAPRPFGPSLADGKRDVLEGRLVWLALRALQLGTNVVLDFGVWAKEERSALHHLALSARARFGLVYMQVDDDEQARRVRERNTEPATAFVMSPAELEL